jgi:GPI mannosyltransferase 3
MLLFFRQKLKRFSGRLNYYAVSLILAAGVFFITAWNSHGYIHADEHYQIIEFAGLKTGTHQESDLAWEYKARLRSAIQPAIAYLVIDALNLINLTNPYFQAYALRLLTALIALLVFNYFFRVFQGNFKTEAGRRFLYFLCHFLWFIPLLSVRFSSETWSGLIFLFALALYFSKNSEKLSFLLGITLGFSFLFRYQIAFAILGFMMWLFIIEHKNLGFFLKTGMGLFLAIVFGFFIDSWFYGENVFVPWNYFKDTVLENAGTGFGISPWYFYLVKLVSYPGYPIGLLLVMSLGFLLIKHPRNVLIWSILPFLLIHSFVPHKEERFLFPVIFLFPAVLAFFLEFLFVLIRNHKMMVYIFKAMIAMLLIINLAGLSAMAVKAAGFGRIEMTRYIHQQFGNKEISLVYTNWANPYNPWNSLPVKFYQENAMYSIHIASLCELDSSLIRTEAENLLIIRKSDLENDTCCGSILKHQYLPVKQSIPPWIEKLNHYYKGFENYNILVLYRYEPK